MKHVNSLSRHLGGIGSSCTSRDRGVERAIATAFSECDREQNALTRNTETLDSMFKEAAKLENRTLDDCISTVAKFAYDVVTKRREKEVDPGMTATEVSHYWNGYIDGEHRPSFGFVMPFAMV